MKRTVYLLIQRDRKDGDRWSDYPYQAVIAFNQQGDADAEARRMNEMWHTSAYTVEPLTLFDI